MLIAVKDAYAKLIDMLGGLSHECNHWRAVHFRFSQLMEHYRNGSQTKIAVNLINDLLKTHQGGIFVLDDATIFLLCRSVTKAQIDKVIFQLRYLFVDDPLAYDAEGQENPEFCDIYELGASYQEFFNLCKKKLALTARDAKEREKRGSNQGGGSSSSPQSAPPIESSAPAPSSGQGASSGGKSDGQLSPNRLAAIERDLHNADLSKVLRRQAVCAAMPKMQVRRVFDELYINIGHLRQLLRSDVDLLSNRWLFKYLTTLLDLRMLDMLRRGAARFFDKPVSLNLNVETLLSDAFMEFDAAIKPSTKVSIVIELHISDVFADMAGFMAAKETAQRLGYRVCLDGLSNLSFIQIDRESLGFDLAKLQWNADMEGDLKSRENQQLVEAIKRCGPNRVILCRCDNKQAVEYGQALGISLFQGRYLDKVLDPMSKIEN